MKSIDELIKHYFSDKLDKGGHPYVNHLYEVANNAEQYIKTVEPENYDLHNKVFAVGILHDILEDTQCTKKELKGVGCDKEIITAIEFITRKKNESYKEFIKRIKTNKLAKIVKIFDLEHNMDIRRLKRFDEYEQKRLRKYFYSWKYLRDEIDDVKYDNII